MAHIPCHRSGAATWPIFSRSWSIRRPQGQALFDDERPPTPPRVANGPQMTPFDDATVGPVRTAVTPGGATFAAGPSRFAPGAIVAGRYRLVALLGRGGMGEVYRADDLTLDQPVALKFLAEDAAASDARVAQFHNELRVARQVSHKNVCRLYDLGEADGRRFLTMEYVD